MGIFSNFAANRRRRKERWEALCKRCGLCCFGKESGFLSTVIYLSKPCEHFDRRTRHCKIYENRFRLCSYCGKVRLYHAVLSRCLPATCGYVEHYRRWRLVRGAEIVKD